MTKEKPSNNSEDVLKKLKADLEEKEEKLNSVKSLELNGKNILKKGQVIKEYGKEVGYIVKNIQTNQEGRKIVKLELADGKTEEYELEDQKVRDKGKNIETIWRKIGTTEGLRIGFPNKEHVDETKDLVKEKLEKDAPQIIVMEHKKTQPKKEKGEEVKGDITDKMPKLEMADKEIRIPVTGEKFFMIVNGKNQEYTITKTRTAKKNDNFLLQAKIDPNNKAEKAIEISPEEFSQKFKDEVIFLPTTEERFQKISEFEKSKSLKKNTKKIKRNEDILNEMAENAEKNREELENKGKEPKTVDELKSHHEIGKKMDEVLLKSLDDIEKKKNIKKETIPKNLSRDTKNFLQEKRRENFSKTKIEIEEKRHKEFENPEITVEDVLKANQDYNGFGLGQIKKDSEKYLKENKEKAILAFKYLNRSISSDKLLENKVFGVNNTTVEKYKESFAKKEAEKWRFKFDEINKKYDGELDSIISKEMKNRTKKITSKMKNEKLIKEVAKTPFDQKIDTNIEEAKKRLKEEINKSAEIAKEKIEEQIVKIHDKSEKSFKKIETEQIKKSEEAKDQARKEYIEAKNQKQPFWKFGFGSKKREQETKEKEEAYMKAKKEYFETSGREDKMDFFLEEKQKFQSENIEKKGLSERIKNGIKEGMNLWENWDKNEKDTKFTQHIKKAGKTFVKIAIIGGASVVTVYGLAGVGIGTATALAGGVGSYIGKKALLGTAFASAINSIPPKHRGWVSKTVLVGSVTMAGISTGGVGALAGIAGYMGSKLIKNKSEENIKKEVDAKIASLKEKKGEKIEKESFEDFEKRQNAIEKELALIEKAASRDRFYRNTKKGALALLIGTATIEMSGAMQDYRDHHQPREYVPRDHDPIPKTEHHHTTPTPENHTLNPDAIIHKGEGIENAFIRQIEHDTEIQKMLHWDGKENLHHFAQHEAHTLAIKEGYVDTNGNEIRVNVADKVGYEIKIENGHATVFEKSLDGKLTDTIHHEGDSFEKNTEKYEYKTTNNTHLEKPVPVTEETTIHPEKPTPVFENTQTNHPQELQPEAPRLQFEERAEPALNLQYEHPQVDAGVIDSSSGVRNFNAFYTANHNEGPTNYQNSYNNGYPNQNIIYRTINPEHVYQDRIGHIQLVEQATKIHDHNIHEIFPKSNDYGNYADKPVRDYLKMDENDATNPSEKELINHIHKVHASTELRPKPGNLFRNPETIEHYLDRAYEEAIKQGKIKEVVIE